MRAVASLCLIAACGSKGSNNDGNAIDAPSAIDAPNAHDAPPPPPGFVPLIGRSWSLQAGQTDTYRCVQITVPQDMYIAAYHADAPQGTHHTVLSITTNPQHADGEYDCSAGALDAEMLFASGVGTDDLAFPADVAFKLTGGQHLSLNLHLFDATDHALTGTTTIYVKALPAPPAQLAEMVFSGTIISLLNNKIPSNNMPTTRSGGCTLSADATITALWPHMHQTATHQLVELTPAGSSTVTKLLDDNYTFAEQKNYPQNPAIQVHAGDKLNTTCTFVNNTGNPIGFGESSLDEMCFTGIYRYPATGASIFSCVDNGVIPPP
jgi:hypothetical protein